MIKLGIECENLEDSKSRWGVGQIILNLLKEYAANPEWQKEFKLYLYFKSRVPDDEVLKNPIFIKRILGFPSFNIFYHILMPIKAMLDRLDWMFFPAYMLPPLYLGKSVVMLTEDVYHEYKYGNLPFRYKLSYRLFTNWAAIKAGKILAMSETSKKNVARLYKISLDQIFVSHLGVEDHMKQEARSMKHELKNHNSLFMLRNSSYILYVGQMFPRRHARESILAFKKIAPNFPNLKFILVGKDKYPPGGRTGRQDMIDNLIKDINKELGDERILHYDYLEKREDINALYVGAKSLIYVSDHEAFGLPPMEALSFGIPPIIADNELGHELFEEYAFYVSSSGPEDIADGIHRALTDSDKINKIKNFGPGFVNKYSWMNFANRFFDGLKK